LRIHRRKFIFNNNNGNINEHPLILHTIIIKTYLNIP
jgi:hypothetical protein